MGAALLAVTRGRWLSAFQRPLRPSAAAVLSVSGRILRGWRGRYCAVPCVRCGRKMIIMAPLSLSALLSMILYLRFPSLPRACLPAVPDLPYNPKRWSPPATILGEQYKTEDARTRAHAAAAAYLPEARSQLHKRYAEAAARAPPGAQLQVTLPSLPVPEATTPAEAMSRHEGPVRAVRWHPRAAVLASGSQAVGLWMPPMPGVVEVDLAGAMAAGSAVAASQAAFGAGGAAVPPHA